MLSKLYNYYLIARESLFYIPAMLCLFYVAVCFGLFWLDQAYAQDLKDLPILFNGDLDDAQNITRVLLSSMITLAVLVVSITMVVLSLSASQLGPRIIRIFMSDRSTKIYIGLLFGSIAACFVLIGLLHEAKNHDVLPRVTVSSVFIVCFFNLFILLAYVQHVAQLSVADNVITKVYAELLKSISRQNGNKEKEGETLKKSSWPKDFSSEAHVIFTGRSGYVQTVDYESVKDLARENDLQVQLLFVAGDYLIKGMQIAKVYPPSRSSPDIEKDIERAIVYGQTPTGSQDIEYSVRHMVEIGLRALSPGINDNYTAIAVLNKLSAALAELFQKGMPERIYGDEEGNILVKGQKSSEQDIIFEAFSCIRNAGQAKPDILMHLIGLIEILQNVAITKDQKQALERQRLFIKDHIESNFPNSHEGRLLTEKYKQEKA